MNPIRVMVVDDSVVVRKIVTDVLSEDPDIEVVGTAVNGKVAVAKLDQLKPDLITMDIEMPEMNGIEAVRACRHRIEHVVGDLKGEPHRLTITIQGSGARTGRAGGGRANPHRRGNESAGLCAVNALEIGKR